MAMFALPVTHLNVTEALLRFQKISPSCCQSIVGSAVSQMIICRTVLGEGAGVSILNSE